MTQGGVYAWGYGGDGSIGDGGTADRPRATLVGGLPTNIVDVASGYSTGYALDGDGHVWAWGSNAGSLGNGTFGTGCDQQPVAAGCRVASPIQVPGLTGVVDIEATLNATFAIKSDGTVWAWGWNAEGELGNGTVGGPACYTNLTGPNCSVNSPVQVPGLVGVADIAPGSSTTSYALKSDGTVLAWGFNSKGQLGNGTAPGNACTGPSVPNCVATTPQAVPGLTGVTALAGGDGFVLAQRADTVSAWGANDYDQLGFPGPGPRATPTEVPDGAGLRAVGAGRFISLAVR
jgi:alpha-tubulin suppressor-like RCC1 family protein